MSKEFVEAFFPASSHFLRTSALTDPLYAAIFTREAEIHCPQVVLSDALFGVRNPMLLLTALVGYCIGVCGGALLKEKVWSLSFLCFGLMNLVAIILHNVLGDPTDHPYIWLMDSYFTGSASTALLVGLKRELQETYSFFQFGHDDMVTEWLYLQILPLIGAGAFVYMGQPIFVELWYLLPTALAAYALFFLLIKEANEKKEYMALYIEGVAAVLLIGGIAMDSCFCMWDVGFLDLLRLPTTTFAACNLAFCGIWYRRLQIERIKPKVD